MTQRFSGLHLLRQIVLFIGGVHDCMYWHNTRWEGFPAFFRIKKWFRKMSGIVCNVAQIVSKTAWILSECSERFPSIIETLYGLIV